MFIGLIGYARSGKDTVADYLVAQHGFTKVAFADVMREALVRLDPWITLNEMQHVSLAQALRFMTWDELKEQSPDVRPLLQRFGTEMGRKTFGEDFWVNLAINRANTLDTKVVFSDVRFLNEAEAIFKQFGDLWKITRPGVGPANGHVSETEALSFSPISHDVVNDGTIEQLHRAVDSALDMTEKAWGFNGLAV